MQFNAYIYIFEFFKTLIILKHRLFHQIFFCKLIQWKQNRLFHVFRKQNRAWKKEQLHRLSFRKCLQIYYQKHHVFIHKIN